MKRVFVFRTVGYANCCLAWLLSLFAEVQTCVFSSSKVKNLLSKVNLVNWKEYLSIDEIHQYRTQAAELWIEERKRIECRGGLGSKFIVQVGKIKVDLSDNMFQVLAAAYEVRFFIRKILPKGTVKLLAIENLETFYLRRYTQLVSQDKNIFPVFSLGLCNMLLEKVGFHVSFLLRKLALIKNCSIQARLKHSEPRHIRLVWDAINPNEYHAGTDKRRFLWFLDGTGLDPKEVLLITPGSITDPAIRDEIKRIGIAHVSKQHELLKYLSNRQLRMALIDLCLDFLCEIVRFFSISPRGLVCDWRTELLLWQHLVSRCGIKKYISSVSSSGNELPRISLLNKLSVKTIMYHYSGTGHSFSSDTPFKPLYIWFATPIHTVEIVWNKDFVAFRKAHSEKLECVITGPLMAGKELLSDHNIAELRNRIIGENDSKKYYISIFDVPSINLKKSNRVQLRTPFPAGEKEYPFHFLRDFSRLSEEFEDIVIIYKPKRSLSSTEFEYPPEVISLFEKNKNNPRWKTIDDAINPWIPPMLADISISMPFTSPSLVALCKERAFLFHDPDNVARYHYHHSLDDYISHSYEELVAKVKAIRSGALTLEKARQTDFYVPEPSGGFTRNLVEYLLEQ